MKGISWGLSASIAIAALGMTSTAFAQDLCAGFEPQTPRDISETASDNKRVFTLAPSSEEMNLCNIHTHTNAEHKGPGFSLFVNNSDYGGMPATRPTA